MSLLRKLHERRTPPGVETAILRRVPMMFAASAFIPFGYALSPRLFPGDLAAEELARTTAMADIFAIAIWLTLWTMVFTLAIGCVIVWLMKGPAYIADRPPQDHPDDW